MDGKPISDSITSRQADPRSGLNALHPVRYRLGVGEHQRPSRWTRLWRDGEATRYFLNGDQIDFQMAVGSCTLIATCYDYFDGCHHWIYLLRQDGRPIDQLRMPDQVGFIQNVLVVADDEISFGYLGSNDRWTLSIDENGFWSFSLTSLGARPNRFLFRRRHLAAQRAKGAAAGYDDLDAQI